jgi:hypothetical protein
VRSSQELDQLVEQAQKLVQGVNPQQVRDNDDLRSRITGEMAKVQTQLEGMLVTRPRRQIIRLNPSRNGARNATNR